MLVCCQDWKLQGVRLGVPWGWGGPLAVPVGNSGLWPSRGVCENPAGGAGALAVVHPPCGNSTGKAVAVAHCLSVYPWHIVFPCTPSSRKNSGALLPCLACPSAASTFPSLPKDKQDGWSSPLQGDASFSPHPPNLVKPLVIHMAEEQPSEFWQQLLHSRLHPWMGSVISRRGAWALLGQRRWEAGVSRKSPLCHTHAGISPVLGSITQGAQQWRCPWLSSTVLSTRRTAGEEAARRFLCYP